MPGERAFDRDPLLAQRLEAEYVLAGGDASAAAQLVREVLNRPDLLPATRFVWPLLVIGQRIARAMDDPTDLLAELHDWAQRLHVHGPVQTAWAATRAALEDPAVWPAAVAAWDAVGQPLPEAKVLLWAADAALNGDDRDTAASSLTRAAALATELDAKPLLAAIESLARRARIGLGAADETRDGTHGLTPREVQVLRLVADGRSNTEIAGELFIAPKTASVHVSHILAKLGVANRVEAAATAHRIGILA